MKFSVVVAIFLLVAKPAYVGTVSERSMEDVPVSSGECLEVLEMEILLNKIMKNFIVYFTKVIPT